LAEAGCIHDPCTTEGTDSDHSTKLEVIVPEDPPEITPDLALVLLTMLTTVHAARTANRGSRTTTSEGGAHDPVRVLGSGVH
jgi:hypothetical protein